MAVRSTKSRSTSTEAETPTQASNGDAPSFSVGGDGKLVKGTGRSKPNPLAGVVAQTEGGNPLFVSVTGAEQAKQAANYIRRDAQELGVGVKVQYQDGSGNLATGDAIREVHFMQKPKKALKYTVADIKRWAGENGHGEIVGRVPEHIRQAYKEAHGLVKTAK